MIKKIFYLFIFIILISILVFSSYSNSDYNQITNNNLSFGYSRTKTIRGFPCNGLGVKIIVFNPKAALNLVDKGEQSLPVLIKLLNDKNRDWASYIMILDVIEEIVSPLTLTGYYPNLWNKHKN